MGWVVTVPEGERSSGQWSRETLEAGYRALLDHGCALLRGVFPPETIDAMYREYLAQWGGVHSAEMARRSEQPAPNPVYWVGESRYEITTRMNGVFGDPHVFANPLLRNFLAPRLGETMRLSGMTVVVSYPGSELQHIHRDHRFCSVIARKAATCRPTQSTSPFR